MSKKLSLGTDTLAEAQLHTLPDSKTANIVLYMVCAFCCPILHVGRRNCGIGCTDCEYVIVKMSKIVDVLLTFVP